MRPLAFGLAQLGAPPCFGGAMAFRFAVERAFLGKASYTLAHDAGRTTTQQKLTITVQQKLTITVEA